MHEDTRRIISEMIALHNLKSERQLAIDAGVTQSTFNRFMRGETDSLDFVNLQKIARYFSLTVSELIGETSFNPDPKVRAVAAAMQNMPEYKKDVLVATSSTLAQPDQIASGGQR